MRKKIVDKRLVEMYNIIGNNIFAWRGKMSQGELAKRAGLSRQTISSIEKGQGVNLETIIKIADALGVEVADLLATDEVRKRVTYAQDLFWREILEKFIAFSPDIKTEKK